MKIIHDEFKNVGQLVCDFCDVKLVDNIIVKQEDPCCEKMNLIKDDGMNICKECGVVYGYDVAPEYNDFYENKYKMKRKRVYIRKYHLINTINDIVLKNNIQINNNYGEKILSVFTLINQDGDRKRTIRTKFVLRQIFIIFGIECELPVQKSKKTLQFYNIW